MADLLNPTSERDNRMHWAASTDFVSTKTVNAVLKMVYRKRMTYDPFVKFIRDCDDKK